MNFDDRPGPINAICLIWVLYIGYGLFHFSKVSTSMPEWFGAYYIGLCVAQLIAIAGFWQMRKWGVLVFTSTVVVEQAMLINFIGFNPASLLLPAIVLMVGMTHYNSMR